MWNEPKRAQELGREKKALETVVETIDHLSSNLSDNTELFDRRSREYDGNSKQLNLHSTQRNCAGRTTRAERKY